MDVSELLEWLGRAGSVFPDFDIRFPFPVAYDIFIRLASSWLLEDSADDLAALFGTAFGRALEFMYGTDEAFSETCLSMWRSTGTFALALLPLMILLSVMSVMKENAAGTAPGRIRIRELIISTLINCGLAASGYRIFSLVRRISSSVGTSMLSLSGLSAGSGFSEIAGGIFLPAMLTSMGNYSEALLVVLMFLRLFLTLILFLSIVLAAVSVRIGILLLYGVGPVCFALSVYEEFEWIRTSWIKTFLGFSLTPALDGLLLALIIRNNENFRNGMNMSGVFSTLCTSIGIACLIVMYHSEVTKKIFDSLIADYKKSMRTLKTAAELTAQAVMAVGSGGASVPASAAGEAVRKGAVRTGETAERASAAGKAAGTAVRIGERKKETARTAQAPAGNFRSESAVRRVLEAMEDASQEECGTGLNTALRREMRMSGDLRKEYDRRGGASGVIADSLLERRESDENGNVDRFREKEDPDCDDPFREAFSLLNGLAADGFAEAVNGGSEEDVRRIIRSGFRTGMRKAAETDLSGGPGSSQ